MANAEEVVEGEVVELLLCAPLAISSAWQSNRDARLSTRVAAINLSASGQSFLSCSLTILSLFSVNHFVLFYPHPTLLFFVLLKNERNHRVFPAVSRLWLIYQIGTLDTWGFSLVLGSGYSFRGRQVPLSVSKPSIDTLENPPSVHANKNQDTLKFI